MMDQIEGRANTPEEKRALMRRLYHAWMALPDLRLGQLLVGSTFTASSMPTSGLFYIEDDSLIEQVERFATTLSEQEQGS